jgi:hypothetical protein
MAREQKIALGEMREMNTRGLLIYCADYRCSHSISLVPERVGRWPDNVRLSDLEPKFICQCCGKRGAGIRPNFAPARWGRSKQPASLAQSMTAAARQHYNVLQFTMVPVRMHDVVCC